MTEALKGNIDSIVDRITTIFFHTSLLLLLMIDVHRLINMRKVAQSILCANGMKMLGDKDWVTGRFLWFPV
jgi:hypothetical protein